MFFFFPPILDCFVKDLEEQIKNEPVGNDLTSVNILMQKQQMIETQMLIKSQQVTELDSQADHLSRMTPENEEEIALKKEGLFTFQPVCLLFQNFVYTFCLLFNLFV